MNELHCIILYYLWSYHFFSFWGEGECYGADGINIVVRVFSCLHFWLDVKHVQNAQLKEIY